MIQFTVLLTLIIILCFCSYKWYTKYYDFFKSRHIPHISGMRALKYLFLVIIKKISIGEMVLQMCATFPNERIIGTFNFRRPSLVIRHPDVAKQLAIKDFDYFEDHQTGVNSAVDELFGNSLFALKGQKWRDMRATLSPAFTGSKMRQMFVLIRDCAEQMAQHFIKQSKNNESMDFDMKELFSRYTNDVIATSAFGIKIDSFEQKDNEFYKMGQLLFKFDSLFKMMLLVIFPKLFVLLKLSFMNPKLKEFFGSMVIETMEYREKEGIYRPDMINILMKVRKGENSKMNDDLEEHNKETELNVDVDGFATVEESNVGKKEVVRKWSDMELVAQCFLFFLAGFETSSNMLTFLAYEVARDPAIQKKLYEEILNNHNENGQQLDYNCLQKLKYLDMVMCETLRLWPAFPTVDRDCVKDYHYDDGQYKFIIEKGTIVSIPVYGFHMDPNYFPNPKCFDPERFNDDNRKNINVNAYLPFGLGPRNCIGSRFALMELKTAIYYLLLNFEFVVNEKTEIPLKLKKGAFVLLPEKAVNLTFKLRSNINV